MQPNEEIITSLRNAIEHGDNLQNAIQIMINSGYNPQEVQEASKYVSQGVISNMHLAEDEELTMPGKLKKESFFSNIFKKKQSSQASPQQSIVQSQPLQTRDVPQPQQPIKQIFRPQIMPAKPNQSLAKQLSQIRPRKHSYLKEIIFLVILIILVGVLIATIVFRDNVLRFLSG